MTLLGLAAQQLWPDLCHRWDRPDDAVSAEAAAPSRRCPVHSTVAAGAAAQRNDQLVATAAAAALAAHPACVLALLVLSLGDPRLGRSQRGRTLVLLIDASASMQARLLAGSGRELSGCRRRRRRPATLSVRWAAMIWRWWWPRWPAGSARRSVTTSTSYLPRSTASSRAIPVPICHRRLSFRGPCSPGGQTPPWCCFPTVVLRLRAWPRWARCLPPASMSASSRCPPSRRKTEGACAAMPRSRRCRCVAIVAIA